jgi:hypothetical protein
VQLAEAAGTHVIYAVQTRGGADALQGGVALNPSLERIDPKSGGAIAFRFHP